MAIVVFGGGGGGVAGGMLGKVNRPTMFFYLAVATTRDEERGEHFCLVVCVLLFMKW